MYHKPVVLSGLAATYDPCTDSGGTYGRFSRGAFDVWHTRCRTAPLCIMHDQSLRLKTVATFINQADGLFLEAHIDGNDELMQAVAELFSCGIFRGLSVMTRPLNAWMESGCQIASAVELIEVSVVHDPADKSCWFTLDGKEVPSAKTAPAGRLARELCREFNLMPQAATVIKPLSALAGGTTLSKIPTSKAPSREFLAAFAEYSQTSRNGGVYYFPIKAIGR